MPSADGGKKLWMRNLWPGKPMGSEISQVEELRRASVNHANVEKALPPSPTRVKSWERSIQKTTEMTVWNESVQDSGEDLEKGGKGETAKGRFSDWCG